MTDRRSGDGREDWIRTVGEELRRTFSRGGEEVDAALRGVLEAAVARLDVVSRDEFEAQAEVLRRARARLEHLEARLAALEADGGAGDPARDPAP